MNTKLQELFAGQEAYEYAFFDDLRNPRFVLLQLYRYFPHIDSDTNSPNFSNGFRLDVENLTACLLEDDDLLAVFLTLYRNNQVVRESILSGFKLCLHKLRQYHRFKVFNPDSDEPATSISDKHPIVFARYSRTHELSGAITILIRVFEKYPTGEPIFNTKALDELMSFAMRLRDELGTDQVDFKCTEEGFIFQLKDRPQLST